MNRNRDYWAKRFEDLEKSLLSIGDLERRALEKEYERAVELIKKDIALWYMRIAQNEGISFADAKMKLSTKELKEFRWTLKDYLKAAKENELDGRWIKELENASARVHIEKFRAMEIQINQQIELLYNSQNKRVLTAAEEIYQEGYYRSIYEVQRGYGFGFSFGALDKSNIQKAISQPWAADGRNFSSRIWQDKKKLESVLQTELTQAFIRGDSLETVVDVVEKRLKASRTNAVRLVATESSFFASASRLEAYDELEVDQFVVVATLDMSTSEICQDMDGKVFDRKDYKIGVTANPFHPHCRSTTAPYFKDNYGIVSERAARNKGGQTYLVPADINYSNWLEKHGSKAV